jgi:hypothetical protein
MVLTLTGQQYWRYIPHSDMKVKEMTDLFAPKMEAIKIKKQYGNIFSRFFWGGVRLTPAEYLALDALIRQLPENLQRIAKDQMNAYNLVQREHDGRALNFYRKKAGKPNDMEGLPAFEQKTVEAPLIRISFKMGSSPEDYHAVLHTVNGRVFCCTFDRRLPKYIRDNQISVNNVEHSWKSCIQNR